MDLQYVIPFIFAGLLILFFIIRAFTVLFHELGHALPAIWMTGEKAVVYVGSYGDPRKSFRLTVGKLEIWLRYNLLFWQRGVCIPPTGAMSANKQIIFTIGGPLASSLLAIPACYFAFFLDLHGAVKLIAFFFLTSALIDLIFNLIPRNRPIFIYEGTTVYNDGRHLYHLILFKRFYRLQAKATKLYNEQKYKPSAWLLDDLVEWSFADEDTLRLAIWANWQIPKYDIALRYYEILREKYPLNADDHCNLGTLLGHLDRNQEAITAFNESLNLDPGHINGLCSKGYLLTILHRPLEALPYLDKAIVIQSGNAYAYSTRGWAKLNSGDEMGGLADIDKALALDPNNAYAHRNMGIYHLQQGNGRQALTYLEKAASLDKTTHLLDKLILEAKTCSAT